jgi:hypothetical protein
MSMASVTRPEPVLADFLVVAVEVTFVIGRIVKAWGRE